MAGDPIGREDMAVGLAEVRTEVRALNIRFDSFGDLLDAKLAPLQRWMEGQPTVCTEHERRLTALEGTIGAVAPAVDDHGRRLVKLEHVSANTVLVGTAAWAVAMVVIGILIKKLAGG